MKPDPDAYRKESPPYVILHNLARELYQRNFSIRLCLIWLLENSRIAKTPVSHARYARINVAEDILIEMLVATAEIKMYCASEFIYFDTAKRPEMGHQPRTNFPDDMCFAPESPSEVVMRKFIEAVQSQVKIIKDYAGELNKDQKIVTTKLSLDSDILDTGGKLLSEILKDAGEMTELMDRELADLQSH